MHEPEIRDILSQHGRLRTDAAKISDDDDLYLLGLTSHASVNVMLALEESLDIEFPDHLLQKSTFQSIASIAAAVAEAAQP